MVCKLWRRSTRLLPGLAEFDPLTPHQASADMTVRFVDGRTINETNLEEVRARVAEFLS